MKPLEKLIVTISIFRYYIQSFSCLFFLIILALNKRYQLLFVFLSTGRYGLPDSLKQEARWFCNWELGSEISWEKNISMKRNTHILCLNQHCLTIKSARHFYWQASAHSQKIRPTPEEATQAAQPKPMTVTSTAQQVPAGAASRAPDCHRHTTEHMSRATTYRHVTWPSNH